MKALFNSTCDQCRRFRPRCATVVIDHNYIIAAAAPTGSGDSRDHGERTLCEDCRKQLRGKFKLHPQHQSGGPHP